MAQLQPSIHTIITKRFHHQESHHHRFISSLESDYNTTRPSNVKYCKNKNQRAKSAVVQYSNTSPASSTIDLDDEMMMMSGAGVVDDQCLVREHGWMVRRMAEEGSEIRKVAQIQAEAFHEPTAFFNDMFFQFFKAEVLSGLLYRLRNSPSDRYACLVAHPITEASELRPQLVGVVDVTVLGDEDVVKHLEDAEEYLYVSGIAVSNSFRRQKVATVLLKACEAISILWGHKYLVLRAYEDDQGARALYEKAGYRVVAGDPSWVSWVGRRRRILMFKRSNLNNRV